MARKRQPKTEADANDTAITKQDQPTELVIDLDATSIPQGDLTGIEARLGEEGLEIRARGISTPETILAILGLLVCGLLAATGQDHTALAWGTLILSMIPVILIAFARFIHEYEKQKRTAPHERHP